MLALLILAVPGRACAAPGPDAAGPWVRLPYLVMQQAGPVIDVVDRPDLSCAQLWVAPGRAGRAATDPPRTDRGWGDGYQFNLDGRDAGLQAAPRPPLAAGLHVTD